MKDPRYARLIPILVAAVLGVGAALALAHFVGKPGATDKPAPAAPAKVAPPRPVQPQAQPAAPTVFLLSIQGIALGANDYVDAFGLKLSGAKVAKVCRVPAGWSVTPARSRGGLDGQASVGAAFLDRDHIGDLRGLALVEIVAGDPATVGVSGTAQVGVYGDMGEARQIKLDHARVALVPTEGCPS
ncbi:hypothetical protein [Caulobacter endophyticus]|uniref:Uncharacterized protein n=1 Tax=Caulobacter endophyticus TaxID=2172652 RepID=A0A2T9K644_9CAUL|nr:hypothetical protein [Caulobacter endophyticus]PVM91455.1 hypothetical protein DDF67_06955 [Caulobacter endophyticus]